MKVPLALFLGMLFMEIKWNMNSILDQMTNIFFCGKQQKQQKPVSVNIP
jgi:hypothetical protein